MNIRNKKILIFGFLAFSFLTAAVTIYNLKFRTAVTSHAQKSTTLSFVPPTGPVNGGDTFNMDVTLTPGTNLVDYIQLAITYDATILQPANPAIVPNPAIFPDPTNNVLQGSTQGPCSGISNTCKVYIILSIGANPSAALQGTNSITIGHVSFRALQPTGSAGTQVGFDISTTVYSLGSQDQLTENVLATANTITLVIGGQSVTPVPTQTTTGSVIIQNMQFTPSQLTVTQGTTVTWTNQEQTTVHTTTSDSQTAAEVWDSGNISPGQSFSHTFNTPGTYPYHCNIHSTMKGTIIVTANTQISPTPSTPTTGPGTPSPAGPPTGSITVHFEAIDQNNNTRPHHPQRMLELDFYKSNNFGGKPDFTTNILVTHVTGDANGSFINSSFDLSFIPQGSYYILVKSPEGSLREQVSPQLIIIGPGLNTLPPVNPNAGNNTPVAVFLRMGDIDNNNSVDVKDYNVIVDCYGKKQTSGSCVKHKLNDAVKGLFADLDDDGAVDGVDYNIVVRHLGEVGY